ncbi:MULTISPECIES: hypothetical protein [Mycobacterium avium complex (MAC)]|uniref:hypothetical protein n=1 Tax=Mycobacterium avium complex (MAC) TaxID=120793 RepID=UPI000AEEC9A2|nr:MULTISPECIES: hypothetical protein [Mycobacterium avium complex (MAC)]MDV3301626.1 hypothetical protein [Mycobacterium avium]
MAEQLYRAVMAVISDGLSAAQAAEKGEMALGFPPHSRRHDSRHSAAVSPLATEDVRDVSRRLGHAKISTTVDIYRAVLKIPKPAES